MIATIRGGGRRFQSTYLYKVRLSAKVLAYAAPCFNPRTYIRYDKSVVKLLSCDQSFQSTYLYKVRRTRHTRDNAANEFQSTYLYKVRHHFFGEYCQGSSFNPRTYIRYDASKFAVRDQVSVSIHVPI